MDAMDKGRGPRNGLIQRQANMGVHYRGAAPCSSLGTKDQPVDFYGTKGYGSNDDGEVFNILGDRHDGRTHPVPGGGASKRGGYQNRSSVGSRFGTKGD